MFNRRLFSAFGLVFGSRKFLEKSIRDIIDYSRKSREEELKRDIENFSEALQATVSQVKDKTIIWRKIVLDRSGAIGWSDTSFPTESKTIFGG
jgi:hypothetical protein